MGECNYYLKARFASPTDVATAALRLTSLLTEGETAYRYWQDLRSGAAAQTRPQAEQFWADFGTRFPLVCVYLGGLNGIADWANGLAGRLGMLLAPDERRSLPNASLSCEDDALYLRMNGVWHMSDLRLLERFCTAHLGAVAVGSTSAYPDDVESDPEEPFDFIAV